MPTEQPIRLGVVGLRRGQDHARDAAYANVTLVALCDSHEQRLRDIGGRFNVALYNDFDKFLEHDMDAVVVANAFHEHAPLAIKALEAGKHVMSECPACHTMAEAVALVRAVEKSDRVYFFGENFQYMLGNQEMRRLYRQGLIGKFLYGECEYVHPFDARSRNAIGRGMNHWRNWMPWMYYCTHSMAPALYIADTRPTKINGFAIPYDFDDPQVTMTVQRGDIAGLILCRLDNDAVLKVLHGQLRGYGYYTRLHGNRGMMETVRLGSKSSSTDPMRIRIWRDPWDRKDDEPAERIYRPEFPPGHERAYDAGHEGGDFYTYFHFARAIRTGEPPDMDVYRGIDISIAGILAHRSALNDSASIDVPDLRKEADRKKYENDDWSPDPARRTDGQPWSSVRGNIEPSDEAKAYAQEVWGEVGHLF